MNAAPSLVALRLSEKKKVYNVVGHVNVMMSIPSSLLILPNIQKYQLSVRFATSMDPPVLINVGIEPAPPQVVIAYFSKLISSTNRLLLQ